MIVAALFTRNAGDPAMGLALVDIDVYLYRRTKTTGAVAIIWAGVQPTEEIGGGLYTRRITAGIDPTLYDYFAMAHYTGAVVLDSDYSLQACAGFGELGAETVWTYIIRTLTQSAAAIIAAVTGNTITQTRAVDWNFSITGMGNISTRTTFYFTLKRRTILPDSEALVQIEETAGLVFINGKPAGVAGAGNGTLTVTDALAGDVTVTVTAAETTKLSEEAGLDYDFKMITGAGAVQQMTVGKFNISSVVTEAIV